MLRERELTGERTAFFYEFGIFVNDHELTKDRSDAHTVSISQTARDKQKEKTSCKLCQFSP